MRRLRIAGGRPAAGRRPRPRPASMPRMKWLARLYARRIINVNVNIVLAGLLALPPVVLTVYLVQYFGLPHTLTFSVGGFSFYTISGISLVAVLDFCFG